MFKYFRKKKNKERIEQERQNTRMYFEPNVVNREAIKIEHEEEYENKVFFDVFDKAGRVKKISHNSSTPFAWRYNLSFNVDKPNKYLKKYIENEKSLEKNIKELFAEDKKTQFEPIKNDKALMVIQYNDAEDNKGEFDQNKKEYEKQNILEMDNKLEEDAEYCFQKTKQDLETEKDNIYEDTAIEEDNIDKIDDEGVYEEDKVIEEDKLNKIDDDSDDEVDEEDRDEEVDDKENCIHDDVDENQKRDENAIIDINKHEQKNKKAKNSNKNSNKKSKNKKRHKHRH